MLAAVWLPLLGQPTNVAADPGEPPRVADVVVPAAWQWSIETVDDDNSNDLGVRPSIAINPATNKPYVSHYDASNGALKLAR